MPPAADESAKERIPDRSVDGSRTTYEGLGVLPELGVPIGGEPPGCLPGRLAEQNQDAYPADWRNKTRMPTRHTGGTKPGCLPGILVISCLLAWNCSHTAGIMSICREPFLELRSNIETLKKEVGENFLSTPRKILVLLPKEKG